MSPRRSQPGRLSTNRRRRIGCTTSSSINACGHHASGRSLSRFKHTIPRGAAERFIHPTHIEYIQGGPTYRRELDSWGVIEHFAIAQVVKQDGYYRFRIHGKVDNRSRTEPNQFRLHYAINSPIQVEHVADVDPSGVTEVVLFLRGPVNGEVKGPQVFTLLWNHTPKAVITEPEYQKLFSKWTNLRGRMEQAATRRAPPAEMDALKRERDGLEKEMNAWTGVSKIYNPEFETDKLPRLLLESIEIEGRCRKSGRRRVTSRCYLPVTNDKASRTSARCFRSFSPERIVGRSPPTKSTRR